MTSHALKSSSSAFCHLSGNQREVGGYCSESLRVDSVSSTQSGEDFIVQLLRILLVVSRFFSFFVHTSFLRQHRIDLEIGGHLRYGF
jgi:hypothetical protein